MNYENELGGLRQQQLANSLDYRSREFLPLTNQWISAGPYWDCVTQESGTFTSNTDWSQYFEAERNPTDRVQFRIATAGGELSLPLPDGSSTQARRLAVLRVFANDHQTITGTYSFTNGDVQFNVNGTLTEIAGTASGNFNFTLVPGYNTIKVVLNLSVDSFMLMVRLFDDFQVRWVNPNADRNPVRGGVTPISNEVTLPGQLSVTPDLPEMGP